MVWEWMELIEEDVFKFGIGFNIIIFLNIL